MMRPELFVNTVTAKSANAMQMQYYNKHLEASLCGASWRPRDALLNSLSFCCFEAMTALCIIATGYVKFA